MSQDSCVCCCHGRRGKVSPTRGVHDGYEIQEIRDKRVLRILHLNPKARDEQFEKDMQTYLRLKERGAHSKLAASGPLKMPRIRMSTNQNVLQENPVDLQSEIPVVSDGVSKESTFGNTLPGTAETGVRSASSIQVAMHQKTGVSLPSENGIGSLIENESSQENSLNLKLQDSLSDLNVHESTSSQDVVLFFIHGVGGSSDIWKAQLNYFSSLGYEIVAPDLIGHGLSAAPKFAHAYHFDEILLDIVAVFDKYCKRKNVIIGHSYGCSFAAVLGRQRSRRVSKLVLISGGSPTPLCPQPGVFTLPICVFACVRPCVQCRYKKGAFSSIKKPVISPEEAFSIPTYVLQHTMNGQIWPEGDEFFHNWIMCPSLLLYGILDQLISLQEEQEMQEAIYNSHLEVIEDASHMVMIEVPDKVNDLILNFLQQGLSTEPGASQRRDSLERNFSRESQHSIRSAKSSVKTMR